MADPAKTVGQFGLVRKELETIWAKLRPLRGGTDAMRKAGTELLPMDWMEVLNQSPDKPRYAERLERSFLFAAYDDAVKRIAARPFQQQIEVTPPEELPPGVGELEDDCDRNGTSLTLFGSQLLDDMADRGFALFIVDRPPVGDEPVTNEAGEPVEENGKPVTKPRVLNLAQELEEEIRPYFARIVPDNIVGWRDVEENGKKRLTELRVRSTVERHNEDFTETRYDVITVWTDTTVAVWEKAVETTSTDAIETQRVRRENEAGHKLVKPPRPHGAPNGRIPLIVAYTHKVSTLCSMPPLQDLAWLNIEHWQSSSQQRNILHYARAPILWGSGMTKEEAARKVQLGPGATLLSSDPSFKLGYAEPGGTSLEAGRLDLEHLEGLMHALGMAPLTETSGPTTATGEVRAENKQQAETLKWVESLEWALFEGYNLAAAWQKAELPEDFKLSIWRDFTIDVRAQQDLATLDAARARGDLSLETYLKELQIRKVISGDVVIEDEIERIDSEGPSLAEMQAQMAPFGQPPQPGQDGEMPSAAEDGEDAEEDEENGRPQPPMPPRRSMAPQM